MRAVCGFAPKTVQVDIIRMKGKNKKKKKEKRFNAFDDRHNVIIVRESRDPFVTEILARQWVRLPRRRQPRVPFEPGPIWKSDIQVKHVRGILLW